MFAKEAMLIRTRCSQNSLRKMKYCDKRDSFSKRCQLFERPVFHPKNFPSSVLCTIESNFLSCARRKVLFCEYMKVCSITCDTKHSETIKFYFGMNC